MTYTMTLRTACGCTKEVVLNHIPQNITVPISNVLRFNSEIGFDKPFFERTFKLDEQTGRRSFIYREVVP